MILRGHLSLRERIFWRIICFPFLIPSPFINLGFRQPCFLSNFLHNLFCPFRILLIKFHEVIELVITFSLSSSNDSLFAVWTDNLLYFTALILLSKLYQILRRKWNLRNRNLFLFNFNWLRCLTNLSQLGSMMRAKTFSMSMRGKSFKDRRLFSRTYFNSRIDLLSKQSSA